MALTNSSTQLGCGRDIDQVWDRLSQPPDAHEQACPYCTAARADLAGLSQATQALRDADTTDPNLQPDPGLLDRILTVARSEVRRGRRLPLDPPNEHQISPHTISEQAVTTVIRRTGDRTGTLQIRRCSVAIDAHPAPDPTPAHAPPTTDHPTDQTTVQVALRVSASPGVPIAQAAHALRLAVIDDVDREVGMTVSTVDITVEDVHDA